MTASIRSLCLAGVLATLSACGTANQADDLAALDAKLTNASENLAAETATNNAMAAGNETGNESGQADPAAVEALGKIETAPAPVEVAVQADADQAPTLGDLALRQAQMRSASAAGTTSKAVHAQPTGTCAQSVQIGPEWAERMPLAFRLYPGAHLVEAGGIDKARCQIAAISFTTNAGIRNVIDFYYTTARRNGYDAEHLRKGAEHQLGGTRAADGAAYILTARAGKDGQTEVDIVASPD